MKTFLLPLLLLAGTLQGFSQASELTLANDCFDKKNYQCAIDHYLLALDKKTFKEGQQYLLEYRIASGYYVLDLYPQAIDYYKKTLLSKPDLIAAYSGLGNTYYALKQFSTAVDYYNAGYEKTTDPQDKEDLCWWLGNSYLSLKQQKMVIVQFMKLQSREGKYITTDRFIADACYKLKKFDSALIYYQKYMGNLAPANPLVKEIMNNEGKCYRELGKLAEAMEQQDAALAIDPGYSEALWEKGILLVNKKEYPAAIEQYKKAFDSLPADSTDHYALAGNIATCYQNAGNYTDAVNWQQKRKNYSANKYVEYVRIAALQYAKLKLPKEAEKTAIAAINAYTSEPAALQTKASVDFASMNAIAGIVALERKDTSGAEKFFAAALQNGKANYAASARMGDIAWIRKNQEDIKKYYTYISRTEFDTLLCSKKDIATVYGRAAYVDAYFRQFEPRLYKYSVEKALEYDSLQREAVLLWPIITLDKSTYASAAQRKACINILDKAAKAYATDNEYLSNLYNLRAVMTGADDTLATRKALEDAVRIYPQNIEPWDNLLKYYSSYDNAKGLVMVETLIGILKNKKDNVTTAAAYVYKGDFHWRVNNKDEAKKAWQEALVWDPNNATAKERVKM
ncbi:MAG: tetratricopeptide repeat protein [Chitinophagaceae bacterium]